MLDAFREEAIVEKVGGRFKLSSLIQKRMVALNRGARPLVELQTEAAADGAVEGLLDADGYRAILPE